MVLLDFCVKSRQWTKLREIGHFHKLLPLKPLVLLVFFVKSRRFHKVLKMDKSLDKNRQNPWYDWVCGLFVQFWSNGQTHNLAHLKPLVFLTFCVKSRRFHKV